MTLYTGDCVEVMAGMESSSVDAVVTSPPYAMQRKAAYGGISECDYPQWFVEVMRQIRRVLKPSGSALVNIREHRNSDGMSDYVHRARLAVRADGWCEVDELIWVKPNGTPTGPNNLPRRAWERILWFSDTPNPYCQAKDYSRESAPMSSTLAPWTKRSGYTNGSLKRPVAARFQNWISIPVGTEQTTHHPAQYPIALATWMIGLVAPPGATVLDPFMGSGTTGVAAVQEGRFFIGIEREPEYMRIAESRIRHAEQRQEVLV